MLTHKLQCHWNHNLVVNAQCSSVMTYEVALAFMQGNFTGLDHKKWCEDECEPKLQALLEDPKGRHTIVLAWDKEYFPPHGTGSAVVTITPL